MKSPPIDQRDSLIRLIVAFQHTCEPFKFRTERSAQKYRHRRTLLGCACWGIPSLADFMNENIADAVHRVPQLCLHIHGVFVSLSNHQYNTMLRAMLRFLFTASTQHRNVRRAVLRAHESIFYIAILAYREPPPT